MILFLSDYAALASCLAVSKPIPSVAPVMKYDSTFYSACYIFYYKLNFIERLSFNY